MCGGEIWLEKLPKKKEKKKSRAASTGLPSVKPLVFSHLKKSKIIELKNKFPSVLRDLFFPTVKKKRKKKMQKCKTLHQFVG